MNPFSETWFRFDSLVVRPCSTCADEFTFVLDQDPTGNKLVLVDLILRVKLDDYPTATPAFLPITVSYRECEIEEFSFV